MSNGEDIHKEVAHKLHGVLKAQSGVYGNEYAKDMLGLIQGIARGNGVTEVDVLETISRVINR